MNQAYQKTCLILLLLPRLIFPPSCVLRSIISLTHALKVWCGFLVFVICNRREKPIFWKCLSMLVSTLAFPTWERERRMRELPIRLSCHTVWHDDRGFTPEITSCPSMGYSARINKQCFFRTHRLPSRLYSGYCDRDCIGRISSVFSLAPYHVYIISMGM